MEDDSRKVVRFAWEPLNLLCEWKDCTTCETSMPTYMMHISKEHVLNLSQFELQCHWKECGHVSKCDSELRRHLFYHAFHTKIKCLGKNFQLRKQLANCLMGTQNRNVIPDLPEPFVCCWDDCREVFESPEYYYNHINFHADSSSYAQTVLEDNKVVKCSWPRCKGTYNNKYKLKDHIKSHTQEKLIACPTCGGMFATRTKFSDHLIRQKPIKRTAAYVCEYCSVAWGTERLLRDHMTHHVNHYKCPYCDMTCPTPSALQNHVDYRHSDVKPHACQYCDYKCKKQNDLRKHLLTHSEAPPYICQEGDCNFTTRTQSNFRDHILTKHRNLKRKQYSCHLCSKITMRGNYLTQHLIKKHNLCWPSGHYRFRYHQHTDGFYRLETVRYESSELSEAVLCDDDNEKLDDPDDPSPDSIDSSNIGLKDSVEIVESNPISNEENILSQNASLSSLPLIMYMDNNNTNEPVSNVPTDRSDTPSESDTSQQKSVILQIVDSDGNPVTFADNSILFSQNINNLTSFQNSPIIEVAEQSSDGKVHYQTAHVIADGSNFNKV